MKKVTPQLNREISAAVARQEKRARLRARIQRLLTKWEPRLGVQVRTWQIKDAQTYWATTDDHEIWFAADLADMPPAFIEIIVVHELAHLLIGGHNLAFFKLMDRHLPGWRRIYARYDKVPALYSHAVLKRALIQKLDA